MSTIRRHGVAFHLVPTPDDGLWIEVVREADDAVLISGPFDGDDDDLTSAVEEWFEEIIVATVRRCAVEGCRACGGRPRQAPDGEDYRLVVEHTVEWEFDLCPPCAERLVRDHPWIERYATERHPGDDLD